MGRLWDKDFCLITDLSGGWGAYPGLRRVLQHCSLARARPVSWYYAMPMGKRDAVLAKIFGGDSAFASKCCGVHGASSLISNPAGGAVAAAV